MKERNLYDWRPDHSSGIRQVDEEDGLEKDGTAVYQPAFHCLPAVFCSGEPAAADSGTLPSRPHLWCRCIRYADHRDVTGSEKPIRRRLWLSAHGTGIGYGSGTLFERIYDGSLRRQRRFFSVFCGRTADGSLHGVGRLSKRRSWSSFCGFFRLPEPAPRKIFFPEQYD